MASAHSVDRISDLPRNILGLILEGLPLHDVARTSILSKTWRNIWVTHSHLIFDDEFISRLISKIVEIEDQQFVIAATISNILLCHRGSIFKFHISIPGDARRLHQTFSMDSWIQNIVNNGIRMLEIVNNQEIAYVLPSHLFACAELTHLQLSKCILKAPLNFRGFRNLIGVELSDVLFTADMSFGSQLQTLDLRRCRGIKHLGCQFNYNSNLSKLKIDSENILCGWSEGDGRVIRRKAKTWKNSIYIDKLLRNIPRIHFLCVDGYFLEFLEQDGAILSRPITTMDNIETLHLVRVGFQYFVQVQYALYLIRSSPNLRHLSIILEPNVFVDGMESSTASRVDHYLQLPNLVDMILDKLESVDIQGMVGSRCELDFIKFLLASSTSLKWMNLWKSVTTDDPEVELRVLRELTRFPRASATVLITLRLIF